MFFILSFMDGCTPSMDSYCLTGGKAVSIDK